MGGRFGEGIHLKSRGAFAQAIELVCLHILKTLVRTAGPVHIDDIDAAIGSKTEVCAEIALREIAAPTLYFTDLGDSV